MPSQKKILKALNKIKKAKKAKKAKRARRSRATQEIKQIVNIKGLGGLSKIGSPPAPVVFQTQREGPVSSSQDFFISALKQLNRVNAPSESTQELKENMKKLELELGKQAMTSSQLILESNLLKNKYANIRSRTDNVGDFSQPNKMRNVAKEEEKRQDNANLMTRRSNRGPMSEESKQKGRETRARNKALKEEQMSLAPRPSEAVFLPREEPNPLLTELYETTKDIPVIQKSDEQDIFI